MSESGKMQPDVCTAFSRNADLMRERSTRSTEGANKAKFYLRSSWLMAGEFLLVPHWHQQAKHGQSALHVAHTRYLRSQDQTMVTLRICWCDCRQRHPMDTRRFVSSSCPHMHTMKGLLKRYILQPFETWLLPPK